MAPINKEESSIPGANTNVGAIMLIECGRRNVIVNMITILESHNRVTANNNTRVIMFTS